MFAHPVAVGQSGGSSWLMHCDPSRLYNTARMVRLEVLIARPEAAQYLAAAQS